MSRILQEITTRYPSFAITLSAIPADESSDLRLMTELAAHSVDLYQAGDIEDVRDAFGMTERLLSSPLMEERDAAVLGFLETLQNVASHRTFGLAAFEQFLGPTSRVAWAEVLEAWRGKDSLAEVVAAETGAELGPRWWQFWKSREKTSPHDLLKNVQNPELRKIIEQITRE